MSGATTGVTYLQMLTFDGASIEPPPNVTVTRLPSPSVKVYRELYNGVGSAFGWQDRNQMPDKQLDTLLRSPDVILHRLTVDGSTAGYCELDCRQPNETELVYFGLYPAFIGQGLGRWFLNWTLAFAWSKSPHRVWLHTCDQDHPQALANYVKAGFQIYDRRIEPVSSRAMGGLSTSP